jgi:hypothetical protein
MQQWPKVKDDRLPRGARARIGAASWTDAPMPSTEGSEKGAPGRIGDPAGSDARIPQQPAPRTDAKTDAQRPLSRLFCCSSAMTARIKTAAPPTDSAVIMVMSDIELTVRACVLATLHSRRCKRVHRSMLPMCFAITILKMPARMIASG